MKKHEWIPLQGRFDAYATDIVVSATRAIGNEELERVEPFDFRELRRYAPGLVAGRSVEAATQEPDEALALAREELADGVQARLARFMPGESHRDLQASTDIERESHALVSWTADSDAGSRRSKWAPHAGQTPLSWRNLLISASRGLTREETDQLARAYDPAAAEGVPDDDPAVEQFELQRSAARHSVLLGIERDAAAKLQQGTIPGSRFRNVKASALLEGLTTRRLALPAWVLSYRYRDKVYRAVVHGQDGQLVIGSSPLSWAKIALVALGGAAVVGLIIALLTRL